MIASGSAVPPGRRTKLAPLNAVRGGTRWTRALTVVSTMRGRAGVSSRRARVAMRSDTISGLGEMRS